MKKYYVEYLPIIGNINVGDYFFTGGGIRKAEATDIDLVGKKLKLFLTVYDPNPKVGDRVYNDLSGFGTVQWNEPENLDFCVKYDKEEHIVEEDIENVIVIYELSPEAKWLVVGNSFNEDEINFVELCNNYNGKHLWKDCSCKMGFITGALIKDPCGYFH